MKISIESMEIEGTTEVKIGGEIDAYTAPKLRESLFPLTEGPNNMVIDLSEVNYLDSTGLGVFVGVFKNLSANNGNLRITGLNTRLMKLFEITGLVNIIDISSKIEGGVK